MMMNKALSLAAGGAALALTLAGAPGTASAEPPLEVPPIGNFDPNRLCPGLEMEVETWVIMTEPVPPDALDELLAADTDGDGRVCFNVRISVNTDGQQWVFIDDTETDPV